MIYIAYIYIFSVLLMLLLTWLMYYTKSGSEYGKNTQNIWYMVFIPVLNFSIGIILLIIYISEVINRIKGEYDSSCIFFRSKEDAEEKVETILNRLDVKDIEKYLRKKKLNKLK